MSTQSKDVSWQLKLTESYRDAAIAGESQFWKAIAGGLMGNPALTSASAAPNPLRPNPVVVKDDDDGDVVVVSSFRAVAAQNRDKPTEFGAEPICRARMMTKGRSPRAKFHARTILATSKSMSLSLAMTATRTTIALMSKERQ